MLLKFVNDKIEKEKNQRKYFFYNSTKLQITDQIQKIYISCMNNVKKGYPSFTT